MTTTTQSPKDEAIDSLRARLSPGDTVYTVLRHVSKSKTARSIDLYVIRDNEPVCITGHAAKILKAKIDSHHGGVKTRGGGMDMGFDLVYNLSYYLFPDGFDLPEGSHGRNGMTDHDPDGGYALKHRWL